MRSILKVVLNSALILLSLAGTGCSILSPRFGQNQQADRCELNLNAARLLESRGHVEKARQMYAEIHQKYPQNAECLHRLGNLCMNHNRLEDADSYFRQAYALDPYSPSLLADMGYAAFLLKDYAGAESLLDRAVRLNGQDRVALKNLAITRGWLEKDAQSLATFRMLFSEADALRQLAMVQAARGDSERSQFNYALASRSNQPTKPAMAIAQSAPPPTEWQTPGATPPVAAPGVELAAHQAAPENAPLINPKLPVLTVQQSPSCARPADSPSAIEPDATAKEIVTPEANSESGSQPAEQQAAAAEVTAPVAEQPATRQATTSEAWDADSTDADCQESPVAPEDQPLPDQQPSEPATIAPVEAVNGKADDFPLDPPAEAKLEFKQPNIWRTVSHAQPANRQIEKAVTTADDVTTSIQVAKDVKPGDDQSPLIGVCLVSLVDERRLVAPIPDFVIEFQSQKYCFSSAEARDKFRADPQRYIPVAGGLDIVSVRNAKVVEQGSINFAVWYQRKLYLFTSAEHAESFRRQPYLYVQTD